VAIECSEGDLNAEIRQYWRFDRDNPGSELIDYPYRD
jgi:hypothetical protein